MNKRIILMAGAAMVTFLVIFFSLGSREIADPVAEKKFSVVKIQNRIFEVPIQYLPPFFRGQSREMEMHVREIIKVVGLSMMPTNKIYGEFEKFNRDEIIIFVDDFTIGDSPLMIIRDILEHKERRADIYGLTQYTYEYKQGVKPNTYMDNDIFLYPSLEDTQVYIDCSSEGSVPNPTCRHKLYSDKLSMNRINLTYSRKYLKDWKLIQSAAEDLLLSFEVHDKNKIDFYLKNYKISEE